MLLSYAVVDICLTFTSIMSNLSYFSDSRKTHGGTSEHADHAEISSSVGKVEHVIFLIHDVMIIIYISRSKCILE